jgi:glycosyltransferase involved in cell wall biosynthesis
VRILFLLPFPPDPAGAHGASRMTGQLLEHAAARHEVGAVYLRAYDEPPIDPALDERLALAIEVRRPGLRGPLRRGWGLLRGRPTWVTDWSVSDFAARTRDTIASWDPELVQAELAVMGQYLEAARAPRVLVDHDPGAATAAELARWERGGRRLGRRLDAAAWRRYERRAYAAAEAVVVFSEEDAKRVAPRAPADRLTRIAPGIALPEPEARARAGAPGGSGAPAGGSRSVLFVGGFGHPPNVEAALRLGRAVFPAVRSRVPGARLEIVGADPPAAVRALAAEGVIVTGRVPDVRPHLDGAAVVVAPLSLGGGVRVKVLEALAAGKPLVATPRALAGIDLEPGEHALVGETDAELADAIAALLEDPPRAHELGAAARAWASENLGWQRALDEYDRLWAKLAETRAVARR